MITYEVTAIVEDGLVQAYEQYMRGKHIQEVMETGCFEGARFSRTEGNRYRITYEAPSHEALERYYAEHASRLRGDYQKHFPTGTEVSRDTWEVLERWA